MEEARHRVHTAFHVHEVQEEAVEVKINNSWSGVINSEEPCRAFWSAGNGLDLDLNAGVHIRKCIKTYTYYKLSFIYIIPQFLKR